METVILRIFLFFALECGILETQELFPWNHYTHKTTYSYLSLFIGCWKIQEIWVQAYSGPVTVDSVEIFGHFAFWRDGLRVATLYCS